MGQNMRAIEQVVGGLENQQLISAEQSERFIKDYESNSPYVSEVNQFISDPTLNKFIKYYVKCRYWHKENRITVSTSDSRASRQSRKELADDMHSLAETQLTEMIISAYKKCEETIHSSLRTLTELLILEKYWMMNWIFVQLLRNCLRVEGFTVIHKTANNIVIYESATDHLQYMDSRHLLYREYTQLLSTNSAENELVINEEQKQIWWRIMQPNMKTLQPEQYMIKISMSMAQSLQNYYTILKQPALAADVLALFLRFMSYHQPYLTTCSNLAAKRPTFYQQLAEQCCFVFDIITTGFRLQQEMLKLQLSKLLNLHYSYSPSSALQYIGSVKREQSPYTLKQAFVTEIKKSYGKVCKILKSLHSYSDYIRQNKIVLDFNRYSELQFCFIHSHQQLHLKLISCWQQNRIKIIDVMGDNGMVLRRLSDVAKNEQKCGTLEQKHGDMLIKIQINNKHIFDGLTLSFDKEDKDPTLCENILEFSREQRDLPSKIQQKLVKDLEKQDPDVKTLGWLALWVKQHVIEKNEKPEPKWQVTDIERIEGRQNINLDVLALSEKQLIIWVWNVMKTNSVFNMLLNKTKNAECFSNFINQIKYNCSINHNPFHNFTHAVNVLHMCYILTTGDNIQQYLTNLDILGVLISGLCHDVGHSGNTNKFETSALNERAMTYNDISPLQNYQASKTFKILKHNGNNFLQDLQTSKFVRLKENIIRNILSTDFSKQTELLVKFEQWKKFDKHDAVTNYHTLTAMIVCASDYAGHCKEFKVACEWGNLMKQEFLRQTEMEKKIGIFPNSQVELNSELGGVIWIKKTLSEVESIVLPLYQHIQQFFPTNSNVKKLVENLKGNVIEWEKSVVQTAKQK